MARLYSSLLTEDISQGEFCDIQVENPGWWAFIFIAPIQSFSNEKKSSSKNLIRGVEILGAQAIGKKASGKKFYALNIN